MARRRTKTPTATPTKPPTAPAPSTPTPTPPPTPTPTPPPVSEPAVTAAPPAPVVRRLFVEPHAAAKAQADAWRKDRPTDAAAMDLIASQPIALWLGEWTKDVQKVVDAAVSKPGIRTLVVYSIPLRDLGSFSAGGTADRESYEDFVMSVARGIRGRFTFVVLEPDAIAMADEMKLVDREARYAMIAHAAQVLTAAGAAVYLDAGDSNWIPADDMAGRLKLAGIRHAAGIALNVSHTETVKNEAAYANKIRAIVGKDKHFLIDTSRSGLGHYTLKAGDDPKLSWCNPPGRALGPLPTLDSEIEGCDALLWIKPPGESDGLIPKGAPKPGTFWPDYALGLVQRSEHAPKIG